MRRQSQRIISELTVSPEIRGSSLSVTEPSPEAQVFSVAEEQGNTRPCAALLSSHLYGMSTAATMNRSQSAIRRPVVGLRSPKTQLVKLPCRSRFPAVTRCTSSTNSDGRSSVETAANENGVEPKKKYYAPAPGNPNVILEYDEPPVDDRPKGKYDPKALALLTGGVIWILIFFITLVSLV
ncbi:hypothetical protein BSKO_06937 [Bryopsis sp. KO-2023]|nr:hypothetical protein BSKO_06937 [Bryopsis sp. KO-2023]